MEFRRFLTELKRRRVYRVAVVYAAVAFVIWQAADFVLPAARLPDWAPTLVLVLTLLGFPIVLVLAWVFDITPEGVKRTQPEGARTDAVVAPPPDVAPVKKSIVVLPFDNMSPDPNDAYFADGLTEEIITGLSCCGLLRVISRNSAMALKGTHKDTRTIAEKLNVQYVLEGSVRKAGDDLRITAQLIDATVDEHLWAERYRGTLPDVFDIQERVSRSIVDALQLQLGPDEERRLVERPIKNVAAYECYLRARSDMWLLSEESLNRASDLLDRGLELVGDNELLYAMKGWLYLQYVNTMSRPPEGYASLLEQGQEYAVKALAINRDSAEAHFALGGVHHQSANPRGAIDHFARAVDLDPNHADATLMLGYHLAAGGRSLEHARLLFDKAKELDPLTPMIRGASGWLDWFNGDFEKALRSSREWQQALEEERSTLRLWSAWVHAASEGFDEAYRLIDQMISDSPGHIMAAAGSFFKYALLKEKQQALGAITEQLEQAAWWDDFYSLMMADGFALIGEHDRAFLWLDRSVDYGYANVRFLSEYEPFLVNLQSDARFNVLMDKARRVSESLGE